MSGCRYNPAERPKAAGALLARYFWEEPPAASDTELEHFLQAHCERASKRKQGRAEIPEGW
jgi:hypothetical protein